MDLAIRPATAAEMVLVRDSWTRSTTPKGPGCYVGKVGDVRLIGWAWYDMHRAWVRSVLAQPDTVVLVATPVSLDEAIGWVCFSRAGDNPLVVHYAYTISDARRHGVARRLVAHALDHADTRPARFSHVTDVGNRIVDGLRVREAVA